MAEASRVYKLPVLHHLWLYEGVVCPVSQAAIARHGRPGPSLGVREAAGSATCGCEG